METCNREYTAENVEVGLQFTFLERMYVNPSLIYARLHPSAKPYVRKGRVSDQNALTALVSSKDTFF